MNILKSLFVFLIIFICGFQDSKAQSTENIVIIIIDGARYTETFGDTERTNIPEMSSIAEEGLIHDDFYNNNYTYTSRAIPAL